VKSIGYKKPFFVLFTEKGGKLYFTEFYCQSLIIYLIEIGNYLLYNVYMEKNGESNTINTKDKSKEGIYLSFIFFIIKGASYS
jgi:hypothetical protein